MKSKKMDGLQEDDEDDDEEETQSTDRFAHESTSDEDHPMESKIQTRAKYGVKMRNPKWSRMFTLRTVDPCEIVTLSVQNLMNLRTQFPEIYEDIFKNQKWKLWVMKRTKKAAIKLCQQAIDMKKSSNWMK